MKTENRSAPGWLRATANALADRAGPFILFGAILVWGWRAWDLARGLPAYDDVLEVTWTISWYDGALRGLHSPWVYPLAFFPTGWQLATFGEGPAMFALLLPLNWLGGAAFAHNVALLLTFVVAFLGVSRLATPLVGRWPAVVASLLFTFWGFRWYGVAGHLNILLASALLPWMVVTLEDAFHGSRAVFWLSVAGILWAVMIACSWYFVWMGGLLLVGWTAGRLFGHDIGWRKALLGTAIPTLVGLAVTAPLLLWFLKGSTAANAPFYDIVQVSAWDASLNSFPAPSVSHPWLQPLAQLIYSGPTNEPGQTNFGLTAFVLALVSLRWAWRDKKWLPVLLITGVGLILALGQTLKWNGETVQWSALRPLDSVIWSLGHHFKPAVFQAEHPPAPFDAAIPLPSLVLSALVPFWERGRVFARYVLLASTGLFMLSALALAKVRWRWARVVLAALLVLEIVPPPTQDLPFPLLPHPAFEWLAQQSLADGETTIDLGSWQSTLLYMPIGGSTLWETGFHHKPTVAGASSVWPAHVAFLDTWLTEHPHAFQNPEFVPILRFYRVQYVILHVSGGYAEEMLAEARKNQELADWHCFDRSPGQTPWDYPICIAQIKEEPATVNVLFREGWSGPERWGRWVEGTQARSSWVATTRRPQQISLDVFPNCIPGRAQHLTLEVNGRVIATHGWDGCEDWQTQLSIPAELVQIGWNELVLRSSYAARPAETSSGQNPDSRRLSIGVTRLEVE